MLGMLPTKLAVLVSDDLGFSGDTFVISPSWDGSGWLKMLRFGALRDHGQVERWLIKGEQSVWPLIKALRVRCAIEFRLETAYQRVRRKPVDIL